MKKAWRLTVRVNTDWWDRIAYSIMSAFYRAALHLRIRRSGPMRLRQDVRRCDDDDDRVMWDMLKKKNKAELGRQTLPSPSARTRSSASLLNVFEWARCSCP